ncbi:MAG: isoprenylcysteine carboxylmethyltransferase family protein [Alphaproteobacteria bacterium]|nr:MAG: isoprenylcysteine carboxylmethyltransferase family protein [Alphaproteobacteria bacterium]
MSEPRDIPGVLAPPPLIYVGFLLAGWGAGQVFDVPGLGLPDLLRRGLAVAGLIVGFGLEAAAAGLFRRARTAIQPWKPSTALVTGGIYRLTRNPIYVGMAIIYAGLAIGMDSSVALILLLPCVLVVDRFVIAREEVYLQARFGPAYLAYRQEVRRWL